MVQSSSSQSHLIIRCCSKCCDAPSIAERYGVRLTTLASGKSDSIQACSPSLLTVRHGPASSPFVIAIGAPWHHTPEPLRHPPASSAQLPELVPADALDSTQCAEPAPLPIPSASPASFPTCCTRSRLTGRQPPSASP